MQCRELPKKQSLPISLIQYNSACIDVMLLLRVEPSFVGDVTVFDLI